MEQSTADLGAAWRNVVDELQPNQRAWLRASEPVTLHESTAIIAVPDDFTRKRTILVPSGHSYTAPNRLKAPRRVPVFTGSV